MHGGGGGGGGEMGKPLSCLGWAGNSCPEEKGGAHEHVLLTVNSRKWMLTYSSYTPCNLLEKYKNSVKFFGQLTASCVRGIEMKLSEFPGPRLPPGRIPRSTLGLRGEVRA